jgi:hypothetical protein
VFSLKPEVWSSSAFGKQGGSLFKLLSVDHSVLRFPFGTHLENVNR